MIFDEPFAGLPNVVVTPDTGVPNTTWASVMNITKNGFIISLYRNSDSPLKVYWIAMCDF